MNCKSELKRLVVQLKARIAELEKLNLTFAENELRLQEVRQQTLTEVKQWLDTLIAETDETHPLEAAHMQLVAIQFDKKYGKEIE